MKKQIIFAFAGWSGAGKTTLIEKILRELTKRGLRAAVIKHDAHCLEFDREGKDSWRFTQAGAQVSIIASQKKMARIELGEHSFKQLVDAVGHVDIILVEGWKNEALPRIGVARSAAGGKFTAPVESFTAVVCDFEIADCPVPVFGPDDIEEICDFIQGGAFYSSSES